jgi:hypothetical protein
VRACPERALSYLFNPTADVLLTEAWERLGRNTAELTGDVARTARISLQMLAVEWTNRGFNLWQVDSQTLTLVVGQADYTLAAATIEPLEVLVTVGGIQRSLAAVGRSDYVTIPNKTDEGTPTLYWAERQASAVVLHLYPTPDTALTVTYTRLRQPQDVTGLGQTLDAPMLWSDALAAGLACRLAEKYAPERLVMLEATYEKRLAAAQRENRQRAPMRMLPRLR